MTHNTDCTIKDDWRDQIDEWAERIGDGRGVPQDVVDEMEAQGWSLLGQGADRVTFMVPAESQSGSPTEQSPCVVKFSKGGLGFQIQEEVSQFQSLPLDITGSEPPIVVPVKDWDTDDFNWSSMPLVQANSGSAGEVDERLLEQGWACNDVRDDNVGQMHNTSVLLDYGMDCHQMEGVMDIADDLYWRLDEIGVRSLTVNQIDRSEALLDFTHPAGMPGSEPPKSSSEMRAEVDPRTQREGVSNFDLVFGTWTATKPSVSKLEAGIERVGERVREDVDFFNSVQAFILTTGGEKEAVVEIDSWDPEWPAVDAADAYLTVVEAIREEMPADQPVDERQQRLEDVRKRVETDISKELEQKVRVGELNQ